MDQQQALLAEVIARPDDDLPRLVYADWLEERGQVDRAHIIRWQCGRLGKRCPIPVARRTEVFGQFVGWRPLRHLVTGNRIYLERVGQPNDSQAHVIRGFVEVFGVRGIVDWYGSFRYLFASNPVRRAILIEAQPQIFDDNRYCWIRGRQNVPLEVFDLLPPDRIVHLPHTVYRGIPPQTVWVADTAEQALQALDHALLIYGRQFAPKPD